MQSLPTEAGPLSKCSQCGNAMPPANGSATFVYGVGPVGYQNCTSCGARWRYLWQESKPPPRRSNRRYVLIGALLVVAILGVVAGIELHSSPRKFGAAQNPKTTVTPETTNASVAVTTEPAPTSPGEFATANDYVRIVGPIAVAKATFMEWLRTTARSTPQYDVNQRVSEFVKLVRDSTGALSQVTFPEPQARDVEKLLSAYKTFINDVDLIRYGLLYSASFADRLDTENAAVRDATTTVRRDLGLS